MHNTNFRPTAFARTLRSMFSITVWRIAFLGSVLTLVGLASPVIAAGRPNVVLIMTDDMGFSDIGCFGSEIETPNIDGLAQGGLRFVQFYNSSRCCPTRASLLTGLYAHQTGIGDMMADRGPEHPGYRGHLSRQCVTIAEVLAPAGYRTIQTGKWHVGDKKKEWWPLARGFQRCFGSPAGGGFYFRPSGFRLPRFVVRNEEVVYTMEKDPPPGWYTTDAYTDEGLEFVKESVAEDKPFFWYCAYNAPHYPLKAKPEDIAKYRGRYKAGWDAIREARYEKLIRLGIIEESWNLSPRAGRIPAWETLSPEQQDVQDLRMATYAAMVDCVDQNVGKIIHTLKELDAFEDTLILFLHDNGGCDAGGILGKNTGPGVCGTVDSEAYYGQCWANVSNTPFRKYKSHIHEGGIATPLVAHWPAGIKIELKGQLVEEPSHIIDIMATIVEATKTEYPTTYREEAIIPLEGQSLLPIFQANSSKADRNRVDSSRADRPLFFEHEKCKGVRQGEWKLVAAKKGPWELYQLSKDRTEQNDLAAKLPEQVRRLEALYKEWAARCWVED